MKKKNCIGRKLGLVNQNALKERGQVGAWPKGKRGLHQKVRVVGE